MEEKKENKTDNKEKDAGGQAPGQPGQQGYYYPPPYYCPPQPQTPKSDKPKWAGYLLITVAILGIIMSGMMAAGSIFMDDIENWDFDNWGTTDVHGRIADNTGAPLDNVTVSILDTHLTTMTNATGHYEILGVPAGFREIRVEKDGYETDTYSAIIADPDEDKKHDEFGFEGDNEFNFTMTPGAGENQYTIDEDIFPGMMENITQLLAVCAVIGFVCSIFALLGGVFALKRERWGMVVMGAVLGIFTIGFGLGLVLAIIALIIVLLAKDEFKKEGDKAAN